MLELLKSIIIGLTALYVIRTKKVSDLFILILPTAFDVAGGFIFIGV